MYYSIVKVDYIIIMSLHLHTLYKIVFLMLTNPVCRVRIEFTISQ